MLRSSEGQCHNAEKVTNEKVIRGKWNFNTNCFTRRPPAHPDRFTNL